MKFDNIIIGGGLSGLITGIESQRAGRNTAIVSTGQSALHFWSGSFEFLCEQGGHEVVDNPLQRAERLDPVHPYRKLGTKRLRALLDKVQPILADAGINVRGSLDRNHYRLTPMGILKPAWLTLDDYLMLDHPDDLKDKKLAIVNIAGYIDFYPRFLSFGLSKHGAVCTTHDVDTPRLDTLRKSTTEMRATNMSRCIDGEAVDDLAKKINEVSKGADAVIMPAILGMFNDAPVKRLREGVDRPIWFVATTPASVPGVRCQLSLIDKFQKLGGTFLPGDTAVKGEIKGNRLEKIFTANFGDMPLEAANFVISTGSFFGHGLVATMDRIYEPILNLDVKAPTDRRGWYEENFYAAQPYMSFGVTTDDRLRPARNGITLENVYATGAVLAGFNALKEGSGAGITLATALAAAEEITH